MSFLYLSSSDIMDYVTKLVMYKTCSPVTYQLRVRTAGTYILHRSTVRYIMVTVLISQISPQCAIQYVPTSRKPILWFVDICKYRNVCNYSIMAEL